MPKSSRILGLFQSTIATESFSTLATVVSALAGPIEEADTLLFRIQRAHRIRVATQTNDVLLLANALNLQEQHFSDLRSDEDISYDRLLTAMKRRVERVARLHLDALGTPKAVVDAAAIMLDAELTRKTDTPWLRRLDAEAYSYVTDIDFGEGRSGGRQRGRIYLHENPLRPRTVPSTPRTPLDAWLVSGDNVDSSPARIVIDGIDDRAVLPSVFCPMTGQGVTFYGVIPAGSRLVIDVEDGARLDGRPVNDWVSFDVGARADYGRYNADGYVVERDGARDPFDGDMSRLFTAPYRRIKPVPSIPPGTTEWVFAVEEGTYDQSNADYAVYALPPEPRAVFDQDPGYDESVYDFAPSASVAMTWYERMPCAFKLLVPAETPAYAPDAPPTSAVVPAEIEAANTEAHYATTDLGRISAFVTRCRAAGVRAFIDTIRPEWVLGESIVRAADASSGPGITTATTIVRLEGSDRIIPVDPATPTSAT
ncbi:MAG TPA: hypothetical protein VES88_12210 [Gemmatimonadaceae bacterium]|nr:hypothetical protein [Gemmatimonadaceae bacterium]